MLSSPLSWSSPHLSCHSHTCSDTHPKAAVSWCWCPGKDTKPAQATGLHKAVLPEVVPGGDRFCMFVIQTVKIVAGMALRGRFIKVAVPFNMNSYHTSLDSRDKDEYPELSGDRRQLFIRTEQDGGRA